MSIVANSETGRGVRPALTAAGEAWPLFHRASVAAGFSEAVAQRTAFQAAENAQDDRLRVVEVLTCAA